MKKGNLPIETAFEPQEEAFQPSPQSISRSQNRNITFSDSEKTGSQTTSIYKDILSQPAQDLSHRQRLQWLQTRRTKGLWVQCDDCDSWRYLATVLDRHELPKNWYCRMNPDASLASCSVPEVPIHIHDEEDLIHSEYAAGSLVLARMPGWPWWPAMVDDCPDTEQYYWLDGFSDIPTHYNVVFFDAFEVTRAWMAPGQLKPYSENKSLLKNSLRRKAYNKRLDVAITQLNDAEGLSLPARLNKYSFIARYKGAITSPKKITKDDKKKYRDSFKRKFNINLENESDSDDDIINKKSYNYDKNYTNNRKKNVEIPERTNDNKEYNDIVNNNNINEDGKESSILVQVDTNSNLIKNAANDTPTIPEFETQIDKDSLTILYQTASTASDDFDF